MAYTGATLSKIVSTIGGGTDLWVYTNTDTVATVQGSGYFSDASNRGLKANDVILYVKTDTGAVSLLPVSSVSAAGAGTVGASLTVVRQAAITALTDSTTGTADNTVADVGAAFNQATLNNNFADLTAKINAILTALDGAGITA